jgi:aspartate carbamoyltransferase catalytic subunit
MQHLISMRDLSREEILQLVDLAEKIEKKDLEPDFSGKIMASLFYEPSTRTQLSFDTAMKRLGGEVISMHGTKGSSVEKGETLADTVKIVSQYADIIVIRHYIEGAARYVSKQVDLPVVNAGDGSNQHPSQSMLDLYSIKKTQGTLNELSIGVVGDLRYGRTVHSLAHALSQFQTKLYFVAPSLLSLPMFIEHELKDMGLEVWTGESVEEILDKVDILYVTRIQRERFADPEEYEKVKDAYVINASMLTNVKENMKILHPLPRVNEIDEDVDVLPYAYYFTQARNGVYMRQAILTQLLGGYV